MMKLNRSRYSSAVNCRHEEMLNRRKSCIQWQGKWWEEKRQTNNPNAASKNFSHANGLRKQCVASVTPQRSLLSFASRTRRPMQDASILTIFLCEEWKWLEFIELYDRKSAEMCAQLQLKQKEKPRETVIRNNRKQFGVFVSRSVPQIKRESGKRIENEKQRQEF